MKFGVLVFPGSNCDQDTYHVIAEVAKQPVRCLWHDSEDLGGVDAILVPGGFAYGDYLRTETANSPFTNQLAKGEVLRMPIGHMEGNYFCEPEVLRELEAEDRIAFRYSTQTGEITAD